LVLKFSSTLDQGANDESFGFNKLTIYYEPLNSYPHPSNVHLYGNSFTGDNWITNVGDSRTSTCQGEKMLGGYGVAGNGAYF